MKKNAIYFGNKDIYQKIKNAGGIWNDSKDRPIVCLLESTETIGLYWGIPVGNWEHRDQAAKNRIEKYMSYPKTDLRSCYYHVGKTNEKSIFFISDVIPIIKKYIDREYRGFDKKLYVIKNKILIQSLEEKLTRILAFESSNNNYFRQRITDIKHVLIKELKNTFSEVAATREEIKEEE